MSADPGPRPALRVRRVRISHTPERGTTLSGTRYHDGLWSMLVTGYLRGCWEWVPAERLYRSPDSIGRVEPDPVVVSRTVRALELLSVEVDVSGLPSAIAPQ